MIINENKIFRDFETLLGRHFSDKFSEVYLIDLVAGREFTYRDLFFSSIVIKNILIDRVERGQHVGLMLSKSSLYLPALLACWQLGVIPAVLDSQMPLQRFINIKSLVNFQYLLVDEYYGSYEKQNQVMLEITNCDENPDFEIKLQIDELNDPSIFLFSTGTTGVPKCVPLSLNNIMTNVESLNSRLNLNSNPTFLCCSPLSYAHGLYNSFLTSLILGGRVIYGGTLNAFNAEKILISARNNNASIFHITPSMIPILTLIGKRTKEKLPNFRYVICGTASLRSEDKLNFEDIYKTLVTQQYGMTETLFMTVNSDGQKNKAGSVGTPLGCELRIINDDGHTLSYNESGNIIVKSSATFGSYYNQSDESNLVYKQGWFHTGDLGFIDRDGYLTVKGRSKEIIKKGGFNINPKEIDSIINRFQDVIEVATIGISDPLYGEEIYSFAIVSKSLDENELNLYCSKSLQPSHMPKKIFFVDHLPRSNSGKILIQNLKELAIELCK